jgi:transcriptional regulator with XRE-family HTH domain
MDISANIKRIRKIKNISQKQIALELGMAQAQYSIIESGKTIPTIPTLQKIADILEVDIIELIKNPGKEEEINLSLLEKVKLLDTLEEEEKRNILGIIDIAISKKKLKENLQTLIKQ